MDFLTYLANLLLLQCTSYPAFNGLFDFLNDTGLSPFAWSSLNLACLLQVLLSLSVVVNRLLFIVRRSLLQQHGRLIFFSSILLSIVIAFVATVLLHEPHFL
ncbi:hypothetical protein PENTCL1PPCAC_4428 [Pristionchus entomophagus]|uniref:G protein-coupled receptor n=1 Tax=Pristionchus entomophagus TaxID=358040 RepID=A0AAV5SJF6_9BILA|nr:hypothetical protein PENTCL1PPCAC_4428 [Pristionchus entomophagus]